MELIHYIIALPIGGLILALTAWIAAKTKALIADTRRLARMLRRNTRLTADTAAETAATKAAAEETRHIVNSQRDAMVAEIKELKSTIAALIETARRKEGPAAM